MTPGHVPAALREDVTNGPVSAIPLKKEIL
jgi:hypothetical protein